MKTIDLIYEDLYYWVGAYGGVFKSIEKKVALGTVRFLAGELMFACSVYKKKWSLKWEVAWCFVDKEKQNLDYMKSFKKRIFCLE